MNEWASERMSKQVNECVSDETSEMLELNRRENATQSESNDEHKHVRST